MLVSPCQKLLKYSTLLHQTNARRTEKPRFLKSSWEALFLPVWGKQWRIFQRTAGRVLTEEHPEFVSPAGV